MKLSKEKQKFVSEALEDVIDDIRKVKNKMIYEDHQDVRLVCLMHEILVDINNDVMYSEIKDWRTMCVINAIIRRYCFSHAIPNEWNKKDPYASEAEDLIQTERDVHYVKEYFEEDCLENEEVMSEWTSRILEVRSFTDECLNRVLGEPSLKTASLT